MKFMMHEPCRVCAEQALAEADKARVTALSATGEKPQLAGTAAKGSTAATKGVKAPKATKAAKPPKKPTAKSAYMVRHTRLDPGNIGPSPAATLHPSHL